jgi:L-aminopeptidase/D-esterase-like protein
MNRIAAIARTGLARSVRPVNTMADGDAIYTFSLGEVAADLNIVGTLAANVLSEAILKAIENTTLSDTEFLQLI